MEKNLISIILPVFNGKNFLAKAIESFLSQTYTHFELIIVNDCSTDNSLQIAMNYVKKDNRIRIINNSINKKLPASLNIGHLNAKGDFLTWTSDDNIAKPFFLESLIHQIKHNKTDIVFSNYDVINEDGSLRRKHVSGPLVNLIYGNTIGASFMYKKEVFEKLKGYNESLYLVEDFDFWLRASLEFSISYLDKNLYQYRSHFNSLTSKIHKDDNIKNKYNNAIENMYAQFSKKIKWNLITELFIKKIHFNQKVDLNNYLVCKDIILKDLDRYESIINSFEPVRDKLWFILRDNLKNQPECHNIKFLLKIIYHNPQILFHKNFSKKQTLILLQKCMKKI